MLGSPDHGHRWGVILSETGDERPKLAGEKTLLALTRHRVQLALPPDRTLFALTKSHELFCTAELAGVPRSLLLVQPSGRGTLPAILWSLLRLVQLDRGAVVAFFPSDYHCGNEGMFMAKVASAFEAAEAGSGVILLGAAATTAEAGYGWIEPQCLADNKLMKVRCFWEKPTADLAQTLLNRGCLSNTFVMVGPAAAFLELIQSAEPDLYKTFQAAVVRRRADMDPEAMTALYERIETADFCKRVLCQAAERLTVLPLGDLGKPVGQAQVLHASASATSTS